LPPTAPARLYCAAESARSADDIVSKQDTHFINVFSMVIALLVAFAVGIFIFARIVASHTQDRQLLSEAAYGKRVAARIAPPGAVAVAGQDNTALAIKSDSPAQAAGTAAVPKSGTEVFDQVCSVCHTAGIAGAPKAGDKAAWGPRIAEGKATLYQHALEGFQGKTGVMPAKGGRTDLPDDLVKQAVDHMLQLAQ
jgi:cytochrome c5